MNSHDHHNPEKYEKQLVELEEKLKQNSNDVQLLLDKSSCLRHLEREDEALEIHDTLISLEPKNLDFIFMKGLLLIEFERYEESLVYFDQVLAVKPEHRDATFNKGLALNRLGRRKEASVYMKKSFNAK
ncbi:MAG: tetratricopeptide repeat protein [Candidatus Heimdallarchaeota archaeon]